MVTKEVIAATAEVMPLLPSMLREIFGELGLDNQKIATILDEPEMADIIRYSAEAHDQKTAQTIANWCLGELQRLALEKEISWSEVSRGLDNLVTLAAMVDGDKLSSSASKDLLLEIVKKNKDPEELAKAKNLLQVSDESDLIMIIEEVLDSNQKAADDVRGGELKAIGFLVGQVMKSSKGRANPAKVQELIKKQLGI